jgi:hypothetical protein
MRFSHSNIYIFIFNPNVDLNRVILMACALYDKILGTYTVHMVQDYTVWIHIRIECKNARRTYTCELECKVLIWT